MRRAFLAIACAVLLAAHPSAALGAPTNGMLAAVVDQHLVTLNADGTGLRTLWVPPGGGDITGLAWAPDGNRLAFSYAGRIVVYDVPAGRGLTVPGPEGSRDASPGWSADGLRLGFRRIAGSVQTAITAAPDGTDQHPGDTLARLTSEFAWAPDFTRFAVVVGPALLVSGLDLPLVNGGVAGAPAWSYDGDRIAFADANGLRTVRVGLGALSVPVTPGPAGAPRWSPDGLALVYPTPTELRTVPVAGGDVRTVITAGGITGADWQPCTADVTASCQSVALPRCSATALAVTTQADQPVDIPPWACTDPAGRPLTVVIVKAPEHGALVGRRYTPAAGFTGQDGVTYRMTNGAGESETVRVTIFVVPRAVAAHPNVKPAVVPRAPFLSARAKPRLDGRRRTLVRLSCDQDCRFAVRLTARLRSKRTLRGPAVQRELAAGHVLALSLRLPAKPAGRLKTVWITGTVRNAAGDTRTVKLPVALPR